MQFLIYVGFACIFIAAVVFIWTTRPSRLPSAEQGTTNQHKQTLVKLRILLAVQGFALLLFFVGYACLHAASKLT
jgi:hypothetical protein